MKMNIFLGYYSINKTRGPSSFFHISKFDISYILD